MKRSVKVADITGRAAVKMLFKPAFKGSSQQQQKLRLAKGSAKASVTQTWLEFITTLSWAKIEAWLFPNMPDHYPLSKKLALVKAQTISGKLWDVLLILFSVLACAIYVSETYTADYDAVQAYSMIELIVTQFFAMDFLYNFFAASNTVRYMADGWTLVDIITIAPVYITIGLDASNRESADVNLSIFRFVRILRLIRILRMFKLLNSLSGVQRQLVTLTLTLVSLIFMAAGVVHIMENDLKQALYYDCNFINADTNWQPSCYSDRPFIEAQDPTCDCVSLTDDVNYVCKAGYRSRDARGEPTGINCESLTFLDALYFLVVTVATVGYGDIAPTTQTSKAIMMGFIITSFILIPVQVNALTELLAANSAYRQPFTQVNGESHVIVCGYIGDWRKLEKFFKEFFHPDRNYSAAPDFHALIISPVEPNDDLKALMYNSHFDGRISYLIGSSLSIEDLQKARADLASAMFFFCNAETPEENATLDDAATVLRTLSVSNFNHSLELFVQVLKPEDRDILKDSEVDVVLCLDEYKTCLQARNAICPGMTALVENILHSFSEPNIFLPSDGATGSAHRNAWIDEYQYGLGMEAYFIPLAARYTEMLSYEWALMVEGIYLEWDVLVIGVASAKDHSLLLNPGKQEMKHFKYLSRFYDKYNQLILLCKEQSLASQVSSGLDDPVVIDRILSKMLVAEEQFTVRRAKQKKSDMNKEEKNKMVVTSLREIIRVAKGWTGVNAQSVQEEEGDSDNDDYVKYIADKTQNKSSATKIARINKLKHRAKSSGGVNEDANSDDDSVSDEDSNENAAETASEAAYRSVLRRQSSFTAAAVGNATRGTILKRDVSSTNDPMAKDKVDHTPIEMEPDPVGGSTFNSTPHSPAIGNRVRSESNSAIEAALGYVEAINEVEDCAGLEKHIIVFGSTANLFQFLVEIRKKVHSIRGGKRESIVVVDEQPPNMWDIMVETFDDIYFLRGRMTRSIDFNRINVSNASSVVLLAGRDSVTRVEGENLDAEALFSYLKLEKYIPRHVFFTVELTCASNMAVLNSTVLRRSRAMELSRSKIGADDQNERKRRTRKSVSEREAERKRVNLENRRLMVSGMYKGAFSSHKEVMKEELYQYLSKGTLKVLSGVPARRVSSIEAQDSTLKDGLQKKKVTSTQRLEAFWTMQDSHHMLAVFASGNAFVPAAFDSLLAQSFYTAFTPLLAERLVCGSKYQSIHQIDVPLPFIGRYFVDLFRTFISRNLLVLAIYRAPNMADGSILPFVFTAPHAEVEMRLNDKIFVICNPSTLAQNLPIISDRLAEHPDGTFGLDYSLCDQLTSASGPLSRKSGDESKDSFSDISARSGTGKSSKDKSSAKKRSDEYRGSIHASNPNPVFSGLGSPVKESVSAVYFAPPSGKRSPLEVDTAFPSLGREGGAQDSPSPRSIKEE